MNIKVPFSLIDDLKVLTDGRLGRDRPLSLIAGDTDNIKGYLYDSPSLPEIRGASILLDKLNGAGIKTILRKHGLKPSERFLLFCAGGGFAAAVPTEKAQAIAADIERLYLDRTGSATITNTIINLVPFDGSPYVPFGEIMAHIAHALRRKKLSKPAVPFYPVSPFVRRCTSCHLRPAICTRDRAGEQLQLCEPCDLKRQGELQKVAGEYRERSIYRREIRRRLPRLPLTFPDTLEDIGKQSTRQGYIAVVAADGNSVGNEIFNLQHPVDYRTFSGNLLKATKEAVFDVLAGVGKDFLAIHKIPIEVVVTGGDDALFVVPCQHGLQTAINVCRRFAEETGKLIHKSLTMSAGVIIAPHDYPMYFLEQMATALLRSSKRLAREKKDGCIDFWFMRGQGTMGTDPLAVRQRMLERSLDSRTRLLFHERPYTIGELEKLVKFTKCFADGGFPRSRLYGLRQSLDVGRTHASLFFLYQLTRSSKDQQKLLRDFQEGFIARPGSVVPWNQKRENGKISYSTPLVDLVDVYDLLGKAS